MKKSSFLLLYVLALPLTYVLPYFGSNSVAATLVTGGFNLFSTLLHLACFVAMLILAGVRGRSTGRVWLVSFPLLALGFDFVPGLSAIPLIPTIFHILALVIGASGEELAGVSRPRGGKHEQIVLSDDETVTYVASASRRGPLVYFVFKLALVAALFVPATAYIPTLLFNLLALGVALDLAWGGWTLWKLPTMGEVGVTSKRVVARVIRVPWWTDDYFSSGTVQVPLAESFSMSVSRSAFGALVGYGTVHLDVLRTGHSPVRYDLNLIGQPEELVQAINDAKQRSLVSTVFAGSIKNEEGATQ